MAAQDPMAAAAAAAASAAADQLESSQVLAQYLELFSYDCNQFKYYLAPNGVLDWFGRSVRGPTKIHEYFRNEVCTQYEHLNFEKAEKCDAIESKAMHFKTKLPTTRKVNLIHPKNRVSGLTTLRSYADSDEEAEDGDVNMLFAGAKTSKRVHKSVIEQLTPPASVVKRTTAEDGGASTAESEDDEDECDGTTKAKRSKQSTTAVSSPLPFSYLRRLPTTATKTAKRRATVKHDEIRTLRDDSSGASSSEDEPDEDYDDDEKDADKYTPLRYLEAKGVLRSQTQPKHRLAAHATTSSAGGWEREVRIRISYRRHIVSKEQTQFALILYEHLDRPSAKSLQTRRNLMLEFSQAEDNVVGTAIAEEAEAEQPAVMLNAAAESVGVATVDTPNTAEIAAALETAAFSIVPLRTPTKVPLTTPATPKRKPRPPAARSMSGLKRLNLSPSSSPSPKRSAARSLRL